MRALTLTLLLAACAGGGPPAVEPGAPASVSAPDAPADAPPAPKAEASASPAPPPTPAMDLARPIALFAVHPGDGAPIAIVLGCVIEGQAMKASSCQAKIRAGDPVWLPHVGATRLGEPAQALCVQNGTSGRGWSVPRGHEVLGPPWGVLGHEPPAGVTLPERRAADLALVERARDAVRAGGASYWGHVDPDATSASVVWSGPPGTIVRVTWPSVDEHKADYVAHFLATDDAMRPLQLGEDLNGVVELIGVVETVGPHLLVATTEWAGGQGIHVAAADADGVRPLGEWVCGT